MSIAKEHLAQTNVRSDFVFPIALPICRCIFQYLILRTKITIKIFIINIFRFSEKNVFSLWVGFFPLLKISRTSCIAVKVRRAYFLRHLFRLSRANFFFTFGKAHFVYLLFEFKLVLLYRFNYFDFFAFLLVGRSFDMCLVNENGRGEIVEHNFSPNAVLVLSKNSRRKIATFSFSILLPIH